MRVLAFLLLALAWGCSSAPKPANTAARQEAASESISPVAWTIGSSFRSSAVGPTVCRVRLYFEQ